MAQHFAVPGSGKGGRQRAMQVFGGTVAVYAPPSAAGESDQLYRVVFDDGDEQDFDDGELAAAIRLAEDPSIVAKVPAATPAVRALARDKQREMCGDD